MPLRELPHPFPREAASMRLEKPFYEKGTDEYKADLESRRGGLRISRKEDKDQILSLREQIKSGVMPDDEIELMMHRNPGAAGALKVARQNRDNQRRLDEILKGSFRPAQAGFQQQGPVQPQAEPLPIIPAQPAQFNAPQAVAQLAAAPGGIEAAQDIANIYGVGKGATARASTKPFERVEESTGDIFRVTQDPHTGETIKEERLGRNIYDKEVIPKLSKEVTASLLPKIVPAVKVIDKIVSKYNTDNLNRPGSGKIAGLGGLQNLRIGRFLTSKAGTRFKGAIQQIENIDIKQLSGAAVTAYEELRLSIQFARNPANTTEEFIEAWESRIRPGIQNLASAIKQGAHPSAVKRYEDRGGFKFSGFDAPVKPIRTTAPTGGEPFPGFNNLSPAEQAEALELLK